MTISRSSVTFYDDQYKFRKSFNSPNLFLACAEYMFEDIEPEGLTEQEKVLFDSLRIRMDNQKKKASAGAKGGKNSRGGGRPQKQVENNEKTTKEQQKNKQKTSKKQAENKEDKVEDKDKVKDKDKDKDKVKEEKNKYLDFVYLSEVEYQNLVNRLGVKLANDLIEKLNNYVGSTGKRYKSHYFTILNWSKNEINNNKYNQIEDLKERERKRIREESQAILTPKQNQDGQSIQDRGFDRRTNLKSG